MAKNNYIFFFLLLIISQLHAAEIMPEIVLSDSGSYRFERVNNDIALVYTHPGTGMQTMRVLPPTLFPLTAIIQSGSVTNQDIIQNLVTVAASNVIFNLNGFNLTQGLVISGRNVRVENGLIDPTAVSASASIANGINVLSGSADVVLDSITVRNATSGILLSGVSGGVVSNCELLFTSTGLELNRSNNIVVENCTAEQSGQIGFNLVSSTTNCFRDCTALATGETNSRRANNNVFGFVANNGRGNIFERCIANSTQALSTTDFNSLIAGFALRGTEGCSKIIECEASNATTSPNGVTIPYGILLEATFSGLVSVTSVNPDDGYGGDDIQSVAWSPDGKYLVVGGGISGITGNDVIVYQFDYVAQVLNKVASVGPVNGYGQVNAVAWSPDGNHLAVGGAITTGNALYVYNFDRDNEQLSVVQTLNPGDVIYNLESIAWSPDGNYLAVGGDSGGYAFALYVYHFDRISQTLTEVDGINPGGNISDSVRSAEWSPDGKYLAVGGLINGDDLYLYSFNRGSQTLIQVYSLNPGGGVYDTIFSVAWSPDGKYLAVGGIVNGLAGNDVYVYRFDKSSQTLTQVSSTNPGGVTDNRIESVAWSSDGKYLAVVGLITGDDVYVYSFDRGTQTLYQVSSVNPDGGSGSDSMRSAAWSPDGQYLAVGGAILGITNNDLFIFQALTFPSTNVIKNNTVYCNSGGSIPSGIGISGSSIANLIIQNTAYANPPSPFMVTTNYAFVQNVFNQEFGDGPTALQNISLAYLVPIVVPADQVLLAKQVQLKLFGIESQLDILETLVDNPLFISCFSTTIMAPTTITASGIYCLGGTISGAILINASNVELDLSNRLVTAGIEVGSGFDQVTIFNGSVTNAGGNALTVDAGATNITISQVRAYDSIIGMDLASVNGARIAYCDLSFNTTGIHLDGCANIMIDNTVAHSNLHAGFSLLNSTTNCLRDCKSFSTGERVTSLNQNIFGFVSNSGLGNIFERCIANATQGLTVTAPNAVVAGFALRADEGCSKLIECESANAATSSAGIATPYGIWLEQRFIDNQLTLTGVPALPEPDKSVNQIVWHPSGRYLAVSVTNSGGASSIAQILIYEFNRLNNQLVLVATPDVDVAVALDLAWSPDGNYLAVPDFESTRKALQVYAFDERAQTLQIVAASPGATNSALPTSEREFCFALDWHPSGRFIAMGGQGNNSDIAIVAFDRVNRSLSIVATTNTSQTADNTPLAIKWRSDGKYFAEGNTVTATETFYVYKYDEGTNTLFRLALPSQRPSLEGGSISVLAVDWSPDGRFLAIDAPFTSGSKLFIYTMDDDTNTVQFIAKFNISALDLAWSADGKYLCVATGSDLDVYEFNRGTFGLSLVAQIPAAQALGGSEVSWSPDGMFLATIGSTPNKLPIYTALSFPSSNLIKDNMVYCNSGGAYPLGVGISGSSIANMIVGNTAYSNPLQQAPGLPLVPSNYTFVTNVFNQMFQNMPTLVQNIAIADSQAICMPQDEALLAKQFCAKVDELGMCSPTLILVPTSITDAGSYCLGQDITGDITITDTCVVIDLNNRCVNGIISLSNAGNTLITNGFIMPPAPTAMASAALSIAANCNRVVIKGVTIDCDASSGDGIQGRDGIQVAANDMQILNCTIKAGNASNRTSAGVGARGGHGISLVADATRTLVQDCVIMQSGNGGAASGAANAGGDAGHGISVASGVTGAKIMNCLFMQTGVGGAGGASANGGRGGDAVRVESGSQDTEVRMCRMRNTGIGGSGSTLGVPGKAVFDLVTTPTHLSAIFNNFAHNIANPTKFDIQAPTSAGGPEDGVLTPNPPTSAVINLFANVYSS